MATWRSVSSLPRSIGLPLHRLPTPSFTLAVCSVCHNLGRQYVSILHGYRRGWGGWEKEFKPVSLIRLSFLQCDDKCQLLHFILYSTTTERNLQALKRTFAVAGTVGKVISIFIGQRDKRLSGGVERVLNERHGAPVVQESGLSLDPGSDYSCS